MSEPRDAAPDGDEMSGHQEAAAVSSGGSTRTGGGEVRMLTDNYGAQWKVSEETDLAIER